MTEYALTKGPQIRRLADGAIIPADPRNTDRAAYEAWLAGGGVPAPVPPPAMADYQAAVDAHVETTARAKGYGSAASCAGYAASTVSAWAAEAAAFIAWRDQVWLEVFEAMAMVQGGGKAPEIAELLASLPAIRWPT